MRVFAWQFTVGDDSKYAGLQMFSRGREEGSRRARGGFYEGFVVLVRKGEFYFAKRTKAGKVRKDKL